MQIINVWQVEIDSVFIQFSIRQMELEGHDFSQAPLIESNLCHSVTPCLWSNVCLCVGVYMYVSLKKKERYRTERVIILLQYFIHGAERVTLAQIAPISPLSQAIYQTTHGREVIKVLNTPNPLPRPGSNEKIKYSLTPMYENHFQSMVLQYSRLQFQNQREMIRKFMSQGIIIQYVVPWSEE